MIRSREPEEEPRCLPSLFLLSSLPSLSDKLRLLAVSIVYFKFYPFVILFSDSPRRNTTTMDRSGLRGSSLFVFRFSCLCTRVQCWREFVIARVKFQSWLIVRLRAIVVALFSGFMIRTYDRRILVVIFFDYWKFFIPVHWISYCNLSVSLC